MYSFSSERMMIVDMNSGSYVENRDGHEKFNLEKNSIDGRYYGYCPPLDKIDIYKNFGAKKQENFVTGILVIYVRKKENSKNREIIGFIPNATIYGTPQLDENLHRTHQDGRIASYSIVSDTLIDLRNETNKFEIEIAKYSSYIFRSQRHYNTYPELNKSIITYIEGILDSSSDDIEEQRRIQQSDPAIPSELSMAADRNLNILSNSQGRSVSKDGRIAKAALEKKYYTCQIDPEHKTFLTTRNIPYMEGHHLIPCTVANAKYFWEKYGKNIDCLENIVCLCPTCHRAVHFGEKSTKEEMIKTMYSQQAEQLKKVGIRITEKELLALYI